MKSAARLFLAVLLIAHLSICLWAGPLRIGGSLSYYRLADPIFREVYGQGNLQFGLSFGYTFEKSRSPVSKRSEIYFEADYFADRGAMTLNKENVSLSIVSLLVGFRYRFIDSGTFKPYLGIGGGVYLYKEDVPSRLEDVSEGAREFHAEFGMCVAVTTRFSLDVNFRYALADTEPFREVIKLGGVRAGLGIGFRL